MKLTKSKTDFKKLNAMAIPILLSYVSGYVFTLGDQAIVGRTGLTSYAAVGAVGNILYAVTGTLGILSLSLNILGAKSLGENNRKDYSIFFNLCLTISFYIGIIAECICIIFGKSILKNFFSMSGEMLETGYSYLVITGLSIGLNMVIFIYSAFFKSIESTVPLLKASILSNFINLVFDYVLVFGKFGFPKLGAIGAAIGTILGLLANVLLYRIIFKKHTFFKYKYTFDRRYLKKIIKSYIPLLGQDFIESSAFILIITAIVTRLGAANIGAYNLIMVIINIMILPMYAYGNVVLTLSAKSYAAKDHDRIKELPWLSLLSLSVLLSAISIIIMLNPSFFCRLITDNGEIIKLSVVVIGYALLIQFLNAANQIFKYLLNGIGDNKWVLYATALISIISLAIIYYLATLFKLAGIFTGLGINYFLLAVVFLCRYVNILKRKEAINIEEVQG